MIVDYLWTNGRFWTGDPARPSAESVDVLHGKIVAVDDTDGLTAKQTHDLGGRRVVPGFHDAHHHHAFTGMRLSMVNLRPGVVHTLDEVYARLEEAAATLPADAWVKASGYDQNHLGAHPTAEVLDRILGGRPCLIEHVSGHMLVANSAALQRAGIAGLDSVPDMPGGRVVRDESGRATGLLQETAMYPVRDAAAGIDEEGAQRILALASEQSVRYGLTSLTEPGVILTGSMGASSIDLHHYLTAVAADTVHPRLTVMPLHTQLHAIEGVEGWTSLDWGMRTGLGDDRLRIGPVKIVSDGSLIGRSAAVHQCYCGEPDNTGVLQLTPDELWGTIQSLHASGWTIATHAIGDRAIDHVLDAIEQAQSTNPRAVRHRIEHFAIARDDQVRRCADLGVIPVPQGVFISDFGDGILEAIGADRSDGTYRMRSLLDAGMVVPGSSDSPVSDANPLVSIHDLVNRRTSAGQNFAPAERVSVEEALRAYTYGSAYAISREDALGTIAPGMLADFVALSDDILTVAPETIRDLAVTHTVIGGDLVYARD